MMVTPQTIVDFEVIDCKLQLVTLKIEQEAGKRSKLSELHLFCCFCFCYSQCCSRSMKCYKTDIDN